MPSFAEISAAALLDAPPARTPEALAARPHSRAIDRDKTMSREARYALIVDLASKRISAEEIGRQVGIGAKQVRSIVEKARREWALTFGAGAATLFLREMQDLEQMEKDAAAEFALAKTSKERARWFELRLRLKEIRAQLLGWVPRFEIAIEMAATGPGALTRRDVDALSKDALEDAYRAIGEEPIDV